MAERLEGVIAAVPTPLDADLRPDHARFMRHARWALDNGCAALNVLGSTGEATSLAPAARMAQKSRVIGPQIGVKGRGNRSDHTFKPFSHSSSPRHFTFALRRRLWRGLARVSSSGRGGGAQAGDNPPSRVYPAASRVAQPRRTRYACK